MISTHAYVITSSHWKKGVDYRFSWGGDIAYDRYNEIIVGHDQWNGIANRKFTMVCTWTTNTVKSSSWNGKNEIFEAARGKDNVLGMCYQYYGIDYWYTCEADIQFILLIHGQQDQLLLPIHLVIDTL